MAIDYKATLPEIKSALASLKATIQNVQAGIALAENDLGIASDATLGEFRERADLQSWLSSGDAEIHEDTIGVLSLASAVADRARFRNDERATL